MIKSQAVVFPEVGKVELREIELPEPADDELLVETRISALSIGTEMWLLTGKYPCDYPIVPGYQRVGVVKAAGRDAKGFRTGDRVLLGHSHLPYPQGGSCENRVCAHTEFAVAAAEHALAIPNNVDWLSASFSWVAAVSAFGVDMARVRPKETVLVIGGGLVGQFSAQMSRSRGAKVLLSEPAPERRRLASERSADAVVDPLADDLAAGVRDATGGKGAAVIIEATGRTELIAGAMECVAPGGRLVLQGYYPEPIALPQGLPHARQLSIYCPGGWRGKEGLRRAVALIRCGAVVPAPLVSRVLKPADAPDFYRQMQTDRGSALAACIEWSSEEAD